MTTETSRRHGSKIKTLFPMMQRVKNLNEIRLPEIIDIYGNKARYDANGKLVRDDAVYENYDKVKYTVGAKIYEVDVPDPVKMRLHLSRANTLFASAYITAAKYATFNLNSLFLFDDVPAEKLSSYIAYSDYHKRIYARDNDLVKQVINAACDKMYIPDAIAVVRDYDSTKPESKDENGNLTPVRTEFWAASPAVYFKKYDPKILSSKNLTLYTEEKGREPEWYARRLSMFGPVRDEKQVMPKCAGQIQKAFHHLDNAMMIYINMFQRLRTRASRTEIPQARLLMSEREQIMLDFMITGLFRMEDGWKLFLPKQYQSFYPFENFHWSFNFISHAAILAYNVGLDVLTSSTCDNLPQDNSAYGNSIANILSNADEFFFTKRLIRVMPMFPREKLFIKPITLTETRMFDTEQNLVLKNKFRAQQMAIVASANPGMIARDQNIVDEITKYIKVRGRAAIIEPGGDLVLRYTMMIAQQIYQIKHEFEEVKVSTRSEMKALKKRLKKDEQNFKNEQKANMKNIMRDIRDECKMHDQESRSKFKTQKKQLLFLRDEDPHVKPIVDFLRSQKNIPYEEYQKYVGQIIQGQRIPGAGTIDVGQSLSAVQEETGDVLLPPQTGLEESFTAEMEQELGLFDKPEFIPETLEMTQSKEKQKAEWQSIEQKYLMMSHIEHPVTGLELAMAQRFDRLWLGLMGGIMLNNPQGVLDTLQNLFAYMMQNSNFNAKEFAAKQNENVRGIQDMFWVISHLVQRLRKERGGTAMQWLTLINYYKVPNVQMTKIFNVTGTQLLNMKKIILSNMKVMLTKKVERQSEGITEVWGPKKPQEGTQESAATSGPAPMEVVEGTQKEQEPPTPMANFGDFGSREEANQFSEYLYGHPNKDIGWENVDVDSVPAEDFEFFLPPPEVMEKPLEEIAKTEEVSAGQEKTGVSETDLPTTEQEQPAAAPINPPKPATVEPVSEKPKTPQVQMQPKQQATAPVIRASGIENITADKTKNITLYDTITTFPEGLFFKEPTAVKPIIASKPFLSEDIIAKLNQAAKKSEENEEKIKEQEKQEQERKEMEEREKSASAPAPVVPQSGVSSTIPSSPYNAPPVSPITPNLETQKSPAQQESPPTVLQPVVPFKQLPAGSAIPEGVKVVGQTEKSSTPKDKRTEAENPQTEPLKKKRRSNSREKRRLAREEQKKQQEKKEEKKGK